MTDQERFARSLGKLLMFAHEQKIEVLMYQLFRTAEQQRVLYDARKSRADGTAKKSMHQLGRAADLAIVMAGNIVWESCEEYFKLAIFWKSIGGRWGGDFKINQYNDIYHFEM